MYYQLHGLSSCLGARGNRIPMKKMDKKEEKSQRRVGLFIITPAVSLCLLGIFFGFLGI